MEYILVSENYENNENILYVRDNLSQIIFKDAKDEVFADKHRVGVRFSLDDKIIRLAIKDIADKISDVIAIKYKYAFFNERLKVGGLDCVNREILLTAIISADLYDDKRYVLSKFNCFNEIAIDGFFNFRLENLKRKWTEICTFIPEFFTERELKEFVLYLINEKTARRVRVNGESVYDRLGNRLKRATLIPGSGLIVFKELLLAGVNEIEMFALPSDENEINDLKDYFGDKILFNSGEIL